MPKDIDGAKASAQRLSGKTASDAFKNGNNAGMLFKKEAKAAKDIHDYRNALQKLRMKEANSNDLRGFK